MVLWTGDIIAGHHTQVLLVPIVGGKYSCVASSSWYTSWQLSAVKATVGYYQNHHMNTVRISRMYHHHTMVFANSEAEGLMLSGISELLELTCLGRARVSALVINSSRFWMRPGLMWLQRTGDVSFAIIHTVFLFLNTKSKWNNCKNRYFKTSCCERKSLDNRFLVRFGTIKWFRFQYR